MLDRIRLTIEYDGTNYSGWQRQINAPSIQETIENALTKLTTLKTCIVGASRTDAGVHALCQVAHFDHQSRIPSDKFAYALNTMLPQDIRIVKSEGASIDFHARFMAKRKIYRYIIHNAPHASAILRNQCAHIPMPLNVDAMGVEALSMLGTHDFAAFAASGSVVKDTVRTIYSVDVQKHENEVHILICGSGFLYNMVRILAGTLIEVGNGKRSCGAINRALTNNNRLELGITAAAKGLTLMDIQY